MIETTPQLLVYMACAILGGVVSLYCNWTWRVIVWGLLAIAVEVTWPSVAQSLPATEWLVWFAIPMRAALTIFSLLTMMFALEEADNRAEAKRQALEH